MDKIREFIMNYMNGRYGFDELNKFFFAIYLIFFILNILTSNSLFYICSILMIIYIVFRCMSRNIGARSQENQAFQEMTGKYAKQYRLCKRMWKDRKTHVYRKCPHCQTMIRLPKVKGHHTTNCPKCHKDFDVKV